MEGGGVAEELGWGASGTTPAQSADPRGEGELGSGPAGAWVLAAAFAAGQSWGWLVRSPLCGWLPG